MELIEENWREDWRSRTRMLIGNEGIKKLNNAHVLVVGVGGVGSWAAEQLTRAGVGTLTIVDGDVVHNSNRNRQVPALTSTVGRPKTEVVGQRLKDINPDLKLTCIQEYIKDERMVEILKMGYDYVIDAIDTLSPKVYLIYHSHRLGLPIVSSMGSGGKYDPTKITIADISETHTCKLAYYMRKRLHKLDVWTGVKAVFSTEVVDPSAVVLMEGEINKKSAVGTISYIPAMFGGFCAAAVIQALLGRNLETDVPEKLKPVSKKSKLPPGRPPRTNQEKQP